MEMEKNQYVYWASVDIEKLINLFRVGEKFLLLPI